MTRPSISSATIRARNVIGLSAATNMICSSAKRRRFWFTIDSRRENSGAISANLRPISSVSRLPRRVRAAAFGKVTVPVLSSPITPDDTPPRTASVNSRRWSSCALAWTSCSRLRTNSSSMRLSDAPSLPISSSSISAGTRSDRLPARTCSATWITDPSGPTIAVARLSPTHKAAIKISNRMIPNNTAKLT